MKKQEEEVKITVRNVKGKDIEVSLPKSKATSKNAIAKAIEMEYTGKVEKH